mmetsp:Transcript_31050/g.56332  ORF Transcript_31050/g.56332 Transcript_31050/m.56332 type:complete len:85 (+) Transcript_31050:18-272(+)
MNNHTLTYQYLTSLSSILQTLGGGWSCSRRYSSSCSCRTTISPNRYTRWCIHFVIANTLSVAAEPPEQREAASSPPTPGDSSNG